jgi:uncharacterized protein YggT (Ycf19 family)
MEYLIYVLVQLARILVWGVMIAMLARSVFSLFMMGEETALGLFLYYVTEPITLPIRLLFKRLGWFEDTDAPIDFPAIFTFVLLMILNTFLS